MEDLDIADNVETGPKGERIRGRPWALLSRRTSPPDLPDRVERRIQGRLAGGNRRGGPRGWIRSFQNGALTRNESQLRLGRLLMLTGYFHALAALVLARILAETLPPEGIPLWLRGQTWIGLGMGLLLGMGGIRCVGWSNRPRRTARRFLAAYAMMLGLDGGWLLWNTAPAGGSLFLMWAGLLTFLLLEAVALASSWGSDARERAFLP